ncbi:hypothetical protein ABIC63_000503 [Pseudacidovorax sp. 1753]|uniref:hypothetical protein n=1 Tax=Pseudacidovorax sp. 1753 TaxID=3156419 RepID=UPI0033977656
MQRVSSMHAFGRGRGARPPGMRLGNLDAQVRAALFGQGQGGYMLSFDRAEALYQDNTGEASAAAATNPLGLVLDQKSGLARGPEVAVNAFQPPSGYASTVSTAGNVITVSGTASGGSTVRAFTPLTTVVGRSYEVVGNIGSQQPVVVFARNQNDGFGTVLYQKTVAANTAFRFVFQATTVASSLLLGNGTGDQGTLSVSAISVREVPGNHFQQATSTARPLRQQDAYGWYADADGTDDFLQSLGNIDYSAFGRLTTFTGVQRLSNPITAIIREISVNRDNNVGTHALVISPDSGRNRYRSLVNFGNVAEATVTDATRLIGGRDVVVTTGVVGDLATVRLNKDQSAVAPGGGGSSPFGSFPHFIFRRGNTTANYFTGRIYAHIEVASNAPLTAQQISLGEAWIRSKMGA